MHNFKLYGTSMHGVDKIMFTALFLETRKSEHQWHSALKIGNIFVQL